MHAAYQEDRGRRPGGGGIPRAAGEAAEDGAPGGEDRTSVFEAAEISRALSRIAHEILERTSGAGDVVLLGIPTRGVPLAHRLAARMEKVEGNQVPAGSLDITMYRDDLRLRPARALGHTAVPATGIDGKIVVLVDGGHRELPIRPDYVGKNLPTSHREVVRVLLTEVDGEDAVLLGEKPGFPGGLRPGQPGRRQPGPGQPRSGQPGPGQPEPGGGASQ